MPEGPEVKRLTETLNEHVKGCHVIMAGVKSGRYMRAPVNLDRLFGATIVQVWCRGKIVIFTMRDVSDDVFYVMSTLGMSGWWSLEPGAHERISFELRDGRVLRFLDQRNFGTIKIMERAALNRRLLELGPDILGAQALNAVEHRPTFAARMLRFAKNKTLAEALLDQRIAAGCGNYIRADAMHLGRISPLRKVSELTPSELNAIWLALQTVAQASFIAGTEYTPTCYARASSIGGNPIEQYVDPNGRTVWWCPAEQST